MSESEDSSDESEEPSPPPEITIPPEWVPGVWANYAQATYSEHEFTLDLVRMDPYHPAGTVVARVAVSWSAAARFADHLGDGVASLGARGNVK